MGIAAFALIPTDALRISRPSKALYLYLIPLLRAQACSARADASLNLHQAPLVLNPLGSRNS